MAADCVEGMSQPLSRCAAPVPAQRRDSSLLLVHGRQSCRRSGLTAPSMHRPAQESSAGTLPARNVILQCDVTEGGGSNGVTLIKSELRLTSQLNP
ncbi:hypothetical protein EYF80_052096 [Liparis tanakae]|uniref:Uncharacterized protein n=1 Tax=Liparis tanakae TaxID=230148 RepID=A0A4Z2F928_9TELE|nr:hypothetical protein EYF80_052096 [Liparis tanakae]